MDGAIQCPRCGEVMSVEFNETENDFLEIECDGCGARLGINYTTLIELDDVEVLSVPVIANTICPYCDTDNDFEEIEEKAGSEQFECEHCGAVLEVNWADWGEKVSVVLVEEPGENSLIPEWEEFDSDRFRSDTT